MLAINLGKTCRTDVCKEDGKMEKTIKLKDIVKTIEDKLEDIGNIEITIKTKSKNKKSKVPKMFLDKDYKPWWMKN